VVRKELIDLVQEMTADESGEMWSKTDCGLAIDYVTSAIMEAVKNGEEVKIQGFGVFKKSITPARERVNPRTGEKIMCDVSCHVKFSVGKTFTDCVKEK